MKSTQFTNDSPFNRIKRKIYLYSFPIIILATLIAFLIESYEQEIDYINKYSLPLLVIWLVIFYVVIVLWERLIPLFELLTFIFLLGFHLFRFYFVLTDGLNVTNYGIDEYTFWIPLLYIFIFLIFKHRTAFLVSLIVFFLSFVMGVYLFIDDFDNKIMGIDTYIQLYLSTLVYIVAVYALLSIVEIYNKSALLQSMAYTDYLTKIFNRRKMEELLENEVEWANEFKKPLSVILIDIDGFKGINDTYGHGVGDSILKEFSELIKRSVRTVDYFARWGGEEFIILATNQNEIQSKEFAERLRKLIESHKFCYVNSVTASFGITELAESDSISSFINRADKALYISKDKGRNQVTLLKPSVS